jgi:hypothetical protein
MRAPSALNTTDTSALAPGGTTPSAGSTMNWPRASCVAAPFPPLAGAAGAFPPCVVTGRHKQEWGPYKQGLREACEDCVHCEL